MSAEMCQSVNLDSFGLMRRGADEIGSPPFIPRQLHLASATPTATATATIPPVAEPAFNPGGGSYASSNPITVTITTATAGANIRYTLDGTNPTQSYGTLIAASSGTASVTPALYTHPTQLKAVAFKSGYTTSAVHGESYSVGDPSSDPCYPVAYFGCDQGGGTNSAMRGGDMTMMVDRETDNATTMMVDRETDNATTMMVDADTATTNAPAPVAVYLYAGDQIVENVTTGYLYFQDSLGNTSHVTDAAGNLLESYTYSAFGIPTFLSTNNTQLSTSAYGIKHLFQGQLWTEKTGLNDYRNRVELPTMGVFMQPDPIGFKGDAANVYRFCNNNAVNRIDPMGMAPERSYTGSITVERQVLMTTTDSWIPHWVTVASATFDVTFTTSGNFCNSDTKSHYQNNLTVKDRFTHQRVPGAGRTDTSITVVPLKGSNTLHADLHVDWWVHSRAAEKDPNLANLEKWHAFGNGSNVKGLLEKGGFWDNAQREIGGKYTAPLHIPSASWAAYWLRMDLETQLDIAKSAQIAAWDQKGAAHDYPKF